MWPSLAARGGWGWKSKCPAFSASVMVGEVQGKRAGISCQVIEMTASTVASLAGTPDLGKGRQEDASTKLHLTFMIFHLEP